MEIKLELIGGHKAAEILEKALKLRNPELAETRRKNAATQRANARRQGKRITGREQRTWQPRKLALGNGRVSEYNPLQSLGLTDLNRPFAAARSDIYYEDMQAGRWHFNPDPIVISAEGYIINGQHRLVAAATVDWTKLDDVPQFVVVWGADRKTALLMDEAKRNTNDRRQIALGYANAASALAA